MTLLIMTLLIMTLLIMTLLIIILLKMTTYNDFTSITGSYEGCRDTRHNDIQHNGT